jgi:hypothetical protein
VLLAIGNWGSPIAPGRQCPFTESGCPSCNAQARCMRLCACVPHAAPWPGARGSAEVGPDLTLGPVDGDLPTEGKDPLRPGVPEGHPDAHHGVRVVAADKVDRRVALLGAVRCSFLWRGLLLEVRRRRPCNEHCSDRPQQAPLAKGTQDPTELGRRDEILAGLQEEHTSLEHCRVSREAICGQDPLDDLDAATPGSSCHTPLRAGPGPRLGGLTVPELGKCSRIGPILAEVLRLARVSNLQSLARK